MIKMILLLIPWILSASCRVFNSIPSQAGGNEIRVVSANILNGHNDSLKSNQPNVDSIETHTLPNQILDYRNIDPSDKDVRYFSIDSEINYPDSLSKENDGEAPETDELKHPEEFEPSITDITNSDLNLRDVNWPLNELLEPKQSRLTDPYPQNIMYPENSRNSPFFGSLSNDTDHSEPISVIYGLENETSLAHSPLTSNQFSCLQDAYNVYNITFTVVKRWQDEFNDETSKERFNMMKDLHGLIAYAYQNYNDMAGTLLEIRPSHDKVLPMNFTEAVVQVHRSNCSLNEVSEPLLNAVLNRQTHLPIIRSSFRVYEIKDVNPEKEERFARCNRMTVPFSSDCSNTPYGCCLDNVRAASSPNKTGCPEVNCPCIEFMLSFAADISVNDIIYEQEYNRKMFVLQQEVKRFVNETFMGTLVDLYIDIRPCDAVNISTNLTHKVSLVDIAFLLSNYLEHSLYYLQKLMNTSRIGTIPVVPHSFILTAAHGNQSNKILENSERLKKSTFPSIDLPQFYEKTIDPTDRDEIGFIAPVIHLDFNDNHWRRNNLNSNSFSSGCSSAFYSTGKTDIPINLDRYFEKNVNSSQITITLWIYSQTVTEINSKVVPTYTESKNRSCSGNHPGVIQQKQTWTHVAVIFDMIENSHRVFVNGSYRDTIQFENCFKYYKTINSTVFTKLLMGNPSPPFQGFLDEIMIYNVSLTENHIKNIYLRCAKLSGSDHCKPYCPPVIHRQEKMKENPSPDNESARKLFPIKSCREYQERCGRYRSGAYRITLPGESLPYGEPQSYITLPVYCDMKTLDGGWTLILNNPGGFKWNDTNLLERNLHKNFRFSMPYSFMRYMERIKSLPASPFQYMIRSNSQPHDLISWLAPSQYSLLRSDCSRDFCNQTIDELILVHMQSPSQWNYFKSELSKNIPYMVSNREPHDALYTVASDVNVDDFGTLVFRSGKRPNVFHRHSSKLPDLHGVSLWMREELIQSTASHVTDETLKMVQINTYYLNVEFINNLNLTVRLEWVFDADHKFLILHASNRSNIQLEVRSINLPLAITFKAFSFPERDQLLLNGRVEADIPIFYNKEDLYLAIISSEQPPKEPPTLLWLHYDYLILNPTNKSVTLSVLYLEQNVTYELKAKGIEDFKGNLVSIIDPKFSLRVFKKDESHAEKDYFIRSQIFYQVQPWPADSSTRVLKISENSNWHPKMVTYFKLVLKIRNEGPLLLDLIWREDLVLTVIEPGDRITYNHTFSGMEDSEFNISFYSLPHDRRFKNFSRFLINGNQTFTIRCQSESVVEYTLELGLDINLNSSNKLLESYMKSQDFGFGFHHEQESCPPAIHGGYSEWSEWSECLPSCGENRTKSRNRTCNYPYPENGGLECKEIGLGPDLESVPCESLHCNVSNDTSFTRIKTTKLIIQNHHSKSVEVLFAVTKEMSRILSWEHHEIPSDQEDSFNITISGNPKEQFLNIRAREKDSRLNLLVGGQEKLMENIENISSPYLLEIKINKLEEIPKPQPRFLKLRMINPTGHEVQCTIISPKFQKIEQIIIQPNQMVDSSPHVEDETPKSNYTIHCINVFDASLMYVNSQESVSISSFSNEYELYVIMVSQSNISLGSIVKRTYNVLFMNRLIDKSLKIVLESSIMQFTVATISPASNVAWKMSLHSIIDPNFQVSIVGDDSNQLFAKASENPKPLNMQQSNENYANFSLQVIVLDSVYQSFASNKVYTANVRFVNLATKRVEVSWESDLFSVISVDPSHEIRLMYSIYSCVNLPPFLITSRSMDGDQMYLNGRLFTFVAASLQRNIHRSILISSVKNEENSKYAVTESPKSPLEVSMTTSSSIMNSTVSYNLTFYNYRTHGVFLDWVADENEEGRIYIPSKLVMKSIISLTSSDYIIFRCWNESNMKPLLLNDTFVLALTSLISAKEINIYTSQYEFYGISRVARLGIKFLNFDSKHQSDTKIEDERLINQHILIPPLHGAELLKPISCAGPSLIPSYWKFTTGTDNRLNLTHRFTFFNKHQFLIDRNTLKWISSSICINEHDHNRIWLIIPLQNIDEPLPMATLFSNDDDDDDDPAPSTHVIKVIVYNQIDAEAKLRYNVGNNTNTRAVEFIVDRLSNATFYIFGHDSICRNSGVTFTSTATINGTSYSVRLGKESNAVYVQFNDLPSSLTDSTKIYPTFVISTENLFPMNNEAIHKPASSDLSNNDNSTKTYLPLITNSGWSPVNLFWWTNRDNPSHFVTIPSSPNSSFYKFLLPISDQDPVSVFMKALYLESSKTVLINGQNVLKLDFVQGCRLLETECYSSRAIHINIMDSIEYNRSVEVTGQISEKDVSEDTNRWIFEAVFQNTLDRTVKVVSKTSDKIYLVDPLGILVVSTTFKNETQPSSTENTISALLFNYRAYDNLTETELRLNESMDGLDIDPSTFTDNKANILIFPPVLPMVPINSFVFINLANEMYVIQGGVLMEMHGFFYGEGIIHRDKIISSERAKSLAAINHLQQSEPLHFDGVSSWIGIQLLENDCIFDPLQCQSGITIVIKISLLKSFLNTNKTRFILDTGSQAASGPGLCISLKSDQIIVFQLTTPSKTWMVENELPLDVPSVLIASWHTDSGLSLFVDGMLVVEDTLGESILPSSRIETSPNLLIGRNLNTVGTAPMHCKFDLFSLTIFNSRITQVQAIPIFLALVNTDQIPTFSSKIRIHNELGRMIKLQPSRGLYAKDGLFITPGNQWHTLRIMDMSKEHIFQLPKNNLNNSTIVPASQRKTSMRSDAESSSRIYLRAEDADSKAPVLINNHPSPYMIVPEKNMTDYMDVVLSAPIPKLNPSYHWSTVLISADASEVYGSNPVMKIYGAVTSSKQQGSGLLLDGMSSYLLVEGDLGDCFYSPGICEKGFSVVMKVMLDEISSADNKSPRFLLDNGGYSNGNGISIYFLEGRLNALVAYDKKMWKSEISASFNQWILVIISWTSTSGGSISLTVNGKPIAVSSRPLSWQGLAKGKNRTLVIGKSSSISDKQTNLRFVVQFISIYDQPFNEETARDVTLFYWTHIVPPSTTRYINVNFENKAGTAVIVVPDKGEHRDSGYLLQPNLILELRLEEKGILTTYPVTFKAYETGKVQNKMLISGDTSLLVNPRESSENFIHVVITLPLKCVNDIEILPDPASPNKYISCWDGIARRLACPSNSIWSQSTKSCRVSGKSSDNQSFEPSQTHINGTVIGENKDKNHTEKYYLTISNMVDTTVELLDTNQAVPSLIIPSNSVIRWYIETNINSATISLVAFALPKGSPDTQNFDGLQLNRRLLISGQSELQAVLSSYSNNTILIIHQSDQNWMQELAKLLELDSSSSENKTRTSNSTESNNSKPVDVLPDYHIDLKNFTSQAPTITDTTPIPLITPKAPDSRNTSELDIFKITLPTSQNIYRISTMIANTLNESVVVKELHDSINPITLIPGQVLKVVYDVIPRYRLLILSAVSSADTRKSKRINGINNLIVPVSWFRLNENNFSISINQSRPDVKQLYLVIHDEGVEWKHHYKMLVSFYKNTSSSILNMPYPRFINTSLIFINLLPIPVTVLEGNKIFDPVILKPLTKVQTTVEGVVYSNRLLEIIAVPSRFENKSVLINGLNSLIIASDTSDHWPSVVIHRPSDRWEKISEALISTTRQSDRDIIHYRNITFLVFNSASDSAFLFDVEKSLFTLKLPSILHQTDSAIEVSTGINDEIQILKLSSQDSNGSPLLINGHDVYMIYPLSSISYPIPLVIHRSHDTNWKVYYMKMNSTESSPILNKQGRTEPSGRRLFDSPTSEKNMSSILLVFQNTLQHNVHIRSISGPLQINTIFPGKAIGSIFVSLPLGQNEELIAFDQTGQLFIDNHTVFVVDSRRTNYTQLKIHKSFDLASSPESTENESSRQLNNRPLINSPSDVTLLDSLQNQENPSSSVAETLNKWSFTPRKPLH